MNRQQIKRFRSLMFRYELEILLVKINRQRLMAKMNYYFDSNMVADRRKYLAEKVNYMKQGGYLKALESGRNEAYAKIKALFESYDMPYPDIAIEYLLYKPSFDDLAKKYNLEKDEIKRALNYVKERQSKT